MPDIGSLLSEAQTTGVIDAVARNPQTQFGTPRRRYLGAELLPERLVEQNEYTEDRISYRSVIANAATRYSPAQKKGGALVGTMRVTLGEFDIASELTSREYDSLLRIIASRPTMEGMAQLVNFLETTVEIPLVEANERARWQAIVSAQVQLRGDNGYVEDVNYSNPAGHRFAASLVWSNNANDPLTDINAGIKVLTDKGFTPNRMFGARKVANILMGNDKMRTRTGRVVVSPSGQIQGAVGRLTLADLNQLFLADGIPALELYDLVYRTMTGTGRFLPDTVLVIAATTQRDENVDLGDGRIETLPDTLGYVGMGRPAGQATPGRVIRTEAKGNKPPRVESEGWQTSLPVIVEPEGFVVISGIS
jgi:hypothetical protein